MSYVATGSTDLARIRPECGANFSEHLSCSQHFRFGWFCL